jgi:hypothetical protein
VDSTFQQEIFMKRLFVLVLGSILACGAAQAQTPTQSKAPAGSTAQCNDGSFSNVAERSTACRDHKGIKTWLGRAAEAVQTQSPAVSATQAAPTTGVPSRTPGTPENPVTSASPATRSMPGGSK